MKQAIADGFLRALCEPRFRELVDEFYGIRGRVVMKSEHAVREAVQFLLTTLHQVLQECHATVVLDRGGDDPCTSQLEDAMGCIDSASDFALNVGFHDTVTFLYLLHGRIDAWEPAKVLRRLDDTLALIGMARVSVFQLWESTQGEQQQDLWRAVHGILKTIEAECTLASAAPPP